MLASTPKLRELGFDLLTYPSMCGSTSTQPLAALIACRYFGADYEWAGRKQRLMPWERWRVQVEAESEIMEFSLQAKWKTATEERLALMIHNVFAANASTHNAYVNLIEGKADIGLLARRPSASELSLGHTKGVELNVVPCALDAFVFIANIDNPVRNLRWDQIRGIYLNQIQTWQHVGGPAAPIIPFHREEKFGERRAYANASHGRHIVPHAT